MRAWTAHAALVLFGLGSHGLAAETVGRWDAFEGSLENTVAYQDPYRDVELDVTYTGPDGGVIEFQGFYDGGATWRFRFMPDRLGTWHYQALFSDGSARVSGSFECVPSDLPGMISRHELNPIWFGFEGGEATLLRSLHIGDRFFAANWPEEDRTRFLDWVQDHGYDTLSIASFHLRRRAEGRGQGWETPDLWPLSAEELKKLERILDELARRRIVVFPFAGFFGRDSAYPTEPDDQELYIRYTVARLGPYWNLLWNVAGPEPQLKNRPFLDRLTLARLARLIRDADPFDHLITVHNRTGPDLYRDEPWTTFGTLQGPKTTDRERLGRELLESHHPEKPLYAQETLWPGNMYHVVRSEGRDYTDADIRKNTWVILMSATNLAFGDMDGNSSSGFSGTLDTSLAVESRHAIVRRVWDFFETLPFGEMRPCPKSVTTGHCLGSEGKKSLVYLDSPGTVDVTLETGTWTLEWIDGRDTSKRIDGGVTSDGRSLKTPAGGDDWLLRLSLKP